MKRLALVLAVAVSMGTGASIGCSTPESFHLFSGFDAGSGSGGAPFGSGGATVGSGGATVGSGGASVTGGSTGSGGRVSTGGNVATGGATGSGGLATTGGASGTASGGMIGTGSGGAPASGGASGLGSGGTVAAGSGGRAASGGATGTGSGGVSGGGTCIEKIQAAGYSSGGKACSACTDHGVSNETKCKALIDCLSPTYPTCTTNMNCFNDCLNKTGDGVLGTCVEGIIASCN